MDDDSKTIDDETLEELKTSHGVIIVRETDWGDVAFRLPTPEEWKRCAYEIQDEQTRFGAQKTLVSVCRIFPDKAAFDKLIKERPALPITFWNEISDEVGLGKAHVRKKS